MTRKKNKIINKMLLKKETAVKRNNKEKGIKNPMFFLQ